MTNKQLLNMEIEFFISENKPLLWKFALLGSIIGGAILGIIGYQHSLQTIPVEQLIGDLRIEEVATGYAIENGFKGCLGGVLLGPLVFILKLGYFFFSHQRSLPKSS